MTILLTKILQKKKFGVCITAHDELYHSICANKSQAGLNNIKIHQYRTTVYITLPSFHL